MPTTNLEPLITDLENMTIRLETACRAANIPVDVEPFRIRIRTLRNHPADCPLVAREIVAAAAAINRELCEATQEAADSKSTSSPDAHLN